MIVILWRILRQSNLHSVLIRITFFRSNICLNLFLCLTYLFDKLLCIRFRLYSSIHFFKTFCKFSECIVRNMSRNLDSVLLFHWQFQGNIMSCKYLSVVFWLICFGNLWIVAILKLFYHNIHLYEISTYIVHIYEISSYIWKILYLYIQNA